MEGYHKTEWSYERSECNERAVRFPVVFFVALCEEGAGSKRKKTPRGVFCVYLLDMDYQEQKPKFRRAIAFDFLGVVAKHDGLPFSSEEKYIEHDPNFEVVEAMRQLREKGYKILLHSTLAHELLEGYVQKHNLPVDEINKNSDVESGNSGKPVAHLYVDDRAFQYRGQTADELVEQIDTFKPYWKQ